MQISRMCGVCASAVVFLCVAACGSSITVMQGKNVTCPTRHPDFPIVGVPLVFADGVVYSATVGREVAALRASDGTMLWQRPVPFAFQWLSVSQGLLLLTVNDAIAAVQVSDGTLRWLAAHGALSPPVVDQGVIYANEGSGGVTALRLSDGHLLWHIMALSPAPNPAFAINTSPVVAGGVVSVEAQDGSVSALRASDGMLMWQSTHDPGLAWGGRPLVVLDGYLFVGGDSLIMARISDGLMGQAPLTTPDGAAISINDRYDGGVLVGDMLYATYNGGDKGNTIYAIRLADRKVLWHAQLETGNNSNHVVAVDNGILLVQGNALTAARTADGTVLWRKQLPFLQYGEPGPAMGAGDSYRVQAGYLSSCTPSQNQPLTAISERASDGMLLWQRPLPALAP